MSFLSPAFARAELADAARHAEVEACAFLGSDASAQDALIALAIATARQVQQRDVLALPYRAWRRLLAFLACDLAYEPTARFPWNKWDLMTAWYLPREEGSCFELDTDGADRPLPAVVPAGVAHLRLCEVRAQHDDAEGAATAAVAGESAGDC